MKKLLEFFIKKRKKNFKFDDNLNLSEILEIAFDLFFGVFRGLILFKNLNHGFSWVGKGVSLKGKNKIKIGKGVRLGDNVLLSGYGVKGIAIRDNVSIQSYSRLIVSADYSNLGIGIEIHEGVGIGEFSRIGGSGGVLIGSSTIIGQYFSCHPENHYFNDKNKSIKHQGTERKKITIGKDCWIGSKVTVTSGVAIGDRSY